MAITEARRRTDDDFHVPFERHTPADGLRHDRHPLRFRSAANRPGFRGHQRRALQRRRVATALRQRRRSDAAAQRHAAVVAEHRRSRVDRGRLPVPLAGHAHSAPLPQVLGRVGVQRRAGRDETAEEEEKTRQTTSERHRRRLTGQ